MTSTSRLTDTEQTIETKQVHNVISTKQNYFKQMFSEAALNGRNWCGGV